MCEVIEVLVGWWGEVWCCDAVRFGVGSCDVTWWRWIVQ